MDGRLRALLLTSLISVLALVVGVAPAATAATGDVACDRGTDDYTAIRHTRIDGDLVVSTSAICVLDHVFVGGRLVVQDGAIADVGSSEIRGESVLSGFNAYLAAYSSTVGDVTGKNDAVGVSLYNSTVRGKVRGSVAFVSSTGSTLGGIDVRASARYGGSRSLNTSRVVGNVYISGGEVDLSGTRVDGELRVVDADAGSQSPDNGPGRWAVRVCASVVVGQVRVAQSHDLVAIGSHPDGSAYGCLPSYAAANSFGTLSIVDNLHSVTVANTTVNGNLRCYGNSGPRGVATSGATVTGARLGQCAG